MLKSYKPVRKNLINLEKHQLYFIFSFLTTVDLF